MTEATILEAAGLLFAEHGCEHASTTRIAEPYRDDMLCCLDALRWARADLHTLVVDGDARVQSVIARWGLRWPEEERAIEAGVTNPGSNSSPRL